MDRRIPLFVALALGPVGQAEAQAPPDGYSCRVTVFSNLGGIHAFGAGEVELNADAAFNPTATSFSYIMRDRMGWVWLSATWDLARESPDGLGAIRSLRIPFHGGLNAAPATIAFSLDEVASAPLPAVGLLEHGPDGQIRAIVVRAPDGPVPELRGHRTFSYALARSDGERMASNLWLLPDWRRSRGAIRSGLARARRMLRRRECDPFYVLHRPPAEPAAKPE